MDRTRLARLEALFWPNEFVRDVWMVVDGARDPQVYTHLRASYMEYSCLYNGQLEPPLEEAAPYLVRLEYQNRYTRQLLEMAWGNSWGIVVICDESLEKLRRHLRTLLVVRGPRGQQLVFRYYDPRVLRVYLPTCGAEDLRAVFGPVETFYVEDTNTDDLWEFRRDGPRLLRNKLSIAAAATAR